jgi:hypothetical protein
MAKTNVRLVATTGKDGIRLRLQAKITRRAMDQNDEKYDFCALTATVQSRVNSDFLHTITAIRLGKLFRAYDGRYPLQCRLTRSWRTELA